MTMILKTWMNRIIINYLSNKERLKGQRNKNRFKSKLTKRVKMKKIGQMVVGLGIQRKILREMKIVMMMNRGVKDLIELDLNNIKILI